jgi:uncharacterized coiled-coil protein SlyX
MMRYKAVFFVNAPVVMLVVWLMSGAAGHCQTSGAPAQPVPLSESLRPLQAQVQELSSILSEMRNELARTREEVKGLRAELSQVQKELTSLRMGLVTPPPSPAKQSPLVAGQGSTEGPPRTDKSIDERLALLAEDQQMLRGKVDEQYQTKVESGSKYKVRLSGIALLNVFANRGSVDNLDVPSLAYERGRLDTRGSFGATMRQSTLGLEVFGPKLANARTSAEIQMDFFGGFPDTLDGTTMGLLRLRIARARLDWEKTSVVAGQDALFFSPLSPTSIASLALPALSYAGNLWTWTPQVRLEHRMDLSDTSTLSVEGGILDSLSGEVPYQQFYRMPQAGEKSRQPAYASRLALSRRFGDRTLALGTGGYYGRQDWGLGRTVDAWAATADWSLPLPWRLSLTGEFYRGRGIGGLGGGTGRSALFSGPLNDPLTTVLGLNTTGGWSQLKFKATEKLEFNGAFGEDAPSTPDLRRFSQGSTYTYASVARNQSGFVNFIYRARSNLLFSVEYRRLWTSDLNGDKVKADQMNLGFGVLF